MDKQLLEGTPQLMFVFKCAATGLATPVPEHFLFMILSDPYSLNMSLLLLMIQILHYLEDPRLCELWSLPLKPTKGTVHSYIPKALCRGTLPSNPWYSLREP